MGEEMVGCCFVIDELEVIDPKMVDTLMQLLSGREEAEEVKGEFPAPEEEGSESQSRTAYSDTYGTMSGQITSLFRSLCLKATVVSEPRVVEGMYKCDLHVEIDLLG